MNYLLQENGSKILQENGSGILLEQNFITTKGTTTFAVGDILRIKDGTDDEWMRVTNVSSSSYGVQRDLAGVYTSNSNPAWKKGATIVNYGQSGDGGIYMTASDANAPYLSIFDHAGSPWSTINTRLRIGNLNGYLGYTTDLYGIAIGETDAYLKYDPTNGLRIKGNINATSGYFGNETDGIIVEATGAYISGDGYFSTSTGTGLRVSLQHSFTGGFTDALIAYDNSNVKQLIISPNQSNILYTISPVSFNGIGRNDVSTCTISYNGNDASSGPAHALLVTTTGSEARSGYAGIKIENSAETGHGLFIVEGASATGNAIKITPRTLQGGNVFVLDPNSYTSVSESRITDEGYLQFPAYYHCSDFDEAKGTALASTVIAKAYWTGSGTNGTQSTGTGTKNHYLQLFTGSTALTNDSSIINFITLINSDNKPCLEFRFMLSDTAVGTNMRFKVGSQYSANYYYYLLFDYSVSTTNLYFSSYANSGSPAVVDTGLNLDVGHWYTLRIIYYGQDPYYKVYLDNTLLGIGTQANVTSSMVPYVSIETLEALEKYLYIDYVKIWHGRWAEEGI